VRRRLEAGPRHHQVSSLGQDTGGTAAPQAPISEPQTQQGS
jgi:hypothetical protein